MEAHFEADVESANVIGELRGREKPDEVVVVGGHLDSWDVGAGATDDGGGCVVTWEALRIMKKLNLRPRRTVRLVLFTNEENGGRGGTGYRDQHRAELSKHVMMLESDGGVFRPLGFGFTGNDAGRATVKAIATLLIGIGADQISPGGGGADIGPSVQEGRIPSMALDVDGSKYFLIHHTPADTIDKIDAVEMAKCAAAVAVMAYVIADLPQRLGNRAEPAPDILSSWLSRVYSAWRLSFSAHAPADAARAAGGQRHRRKSGRRRSRWRRSAKALEQPVANWHAETAGRCTRHGGRRLTNSLQTHCWTSKRNSAASSERR